MPRTDDRGVELFYDADGSGETVAFVPDAGLGAWAWGWQHAAVAGPFEALTWDLRGTGRSEAPPGPYDVATLAADLEAVLADHGARRTHLVGLGLGGMVALEYARTFGRARSLTLVGSSPGPDAAVPEAVREDLLDPDRRASLDVLLSAEFREAYPGVVEDIVAWRERDDADPDAHAAQLSAAAGFDATGWLHEVTLPALVCHGSDDRCWSAADGRRLAERLPRGEFRGYEDAGHLVTVERSGFVNDDLLGFLEDRDDG